MKTKISAINWLPYILGIGLVFFIVHAPAQPGLVYDPETQTYSGIFLPHIGLALIIVSSFAVVARGKIDWGPKWVWIPMLVIVVSMAARLLVDPTMKTLSGMLFGIAIFCVYLACRKLGQDVFKPITVAVVIQAVSLVVIGLFISPGIKGGGIISYPTHNYDIATGFLVFGTVLAVGRRQWIVASIAMVGLIFTGAEEAMLATAIIGIVILARRDWGRRLLVPIGIVVVTAIIVFGFGVGQSLYESNVYKMKTLATGEFVGRRITPGGDGVTYPREFYTDEEGVSYLVQYDHEWEEVLDNALYWRWTGWKKAVNDIAPLGHGYEVTEFNFYTVHNVPLIIVDQLGIAAALAWLFMLIMGLIKTKWKYAFVAVIALSLFDHYIWTQMAPFFPALLGVSTASTLKSDLIFRG